MRVREDLHLLKRRASFLAAVVALLFAGLFLRLADLQLLTAAHWRQLALNNRLRRVPVLAERGRIYDRTGRVLAGNRPAYKLLLFPNEPRRLDETILFLARLGLGSAAELNERIRSVTRSSLAPLVVGEDLSWEQVTRIRAHQSDHPELVVVSGFRRHYPYGPLTAHAVGHLRPLRREELESSPARRASGLVGAVGVEALAEPLLAGRDGERRVVVNAVGRQLGIVEETPSVPGADLTLTLDLDLQRAAAEALGEDSGAVVALDPRTGAVRAYYSSPAFDPNLFSGRLSPGIWAALRDDPLHPLQDRCIQGLYPPGSTIKPFYALAGLGTASVTPAWSIFCNGAVQLFGHTFRCWRRGGHGRVALSRSLEVSCDVYYYTLGVRLGIETLAAWLERFGFGRPTGIGLPSERTGLVGTPEWARRVRHRPWYPGTTVSVSIGQGPLLATPLQLARAYAALANGGTLVVPHLVDPGTATEGSPLGLDPGILGPVIRGLVDVVHGTEGTARSLSGLPVAGKTGTAQVARLQEGKKVEELERRLRHHALFVGWEPLEAPDLVVAVVVEHGGSGGGRAAPAAGLVFAAGLRAGLSGGQPGDGALPPPPGGSAAAPVTEPSGIH